MLRNNCNHEIKLQINHNEERTKSSQFVKSALYDSANAIFQGKIFVDSKAQKTDGYQLSRALLLSDNVKFFPNLNLKFMPTMLNARMVHHLEVSMKSLSFI